MKVYFSNVNFSSASGPNSFATRLAHQLNLSGHIIADKHDYDISLVFIENDGTLQDGKPYVQRLDGIWFKPDEYAWKNANIKKTFDKANGIIFQSEFNKNQITKWWGTPAESVVIPNGIDLQPMTESLPGFMKLRNEYEQIFVCSANWHAQKRLKENIRFYKHIRKTYPKSCLVVLGNNPDYVISDPHIFYTGPLSHDECLKLYVVANWMIHLSWLDHCPNVVVEALSQGTPVICSSDGGTKELVKTNGVFIDEISTYDFTLRNYDDPPMLPNDFGGITTLPNIKVDPSHLDIKIAAKKYVDLFKRILNEQ